MGIKFKVALKLFANSPNLVSLNFKIKISLPKKCHKDKFIETKFIPPFHINSNPKSFRA